VVSAISGGTGKYMGARGQLTKYAEYGRFVCAGVYAAEIMQIEKREYSSDEQAG
jgi:hypothetical protein